MLLWSLMRARTLRLKAVTRFLVFFVALALGLTVLLVFLETQSINKNRHPSSTTINSGSRDGYVAVDYAPLKQTYQSSYRVNLDGTAQIIEYNLSRKTILSVRTGTLSPELIDQLVTALEKRTSSPCGRITRLMILFMRET